MLTRHRLLQLVGTLLALALASPAHAQSITEPEVEKGQRKLEAFSVFQSPA